MATIETIVKATDASSAVFAKIAASADGLDKQLKDLGERVADPEVNLKDAKFTAGIIKAAERIDKLSAKVADPTVEVNTKQAQLEILRINAMLDRLDAKRVSVTVGVDRSLRSRFGSLFGGGMEKGLGALAGIGASGGGGFGGTPLLYGGLGVLAALLGPGLLPLGLGALVGGGGAFGALSIGTKGAAALKADRQALARARASLAGTKGPGSPSQLLSLQLAQRNLARDQALYGDFTPLTRAFTGISRTALGVFSGALESTGRGFSGAGPNQSFLTSLVGIFRQIGGFIKSIGPQLGNMFRASVPYLQMFVTFLERATKTLLPVFSNLLRQFTPYLPIMAKGLMNIVQGLALFLKALGPQGMQTSAKLFLFATKGISLALQVLGWYINRVLVRLPIYAHNVAVVFDSVRHTVADWAHNIAVWFDRFRHAAADTFDSIKNAVLAWWHFWVDVWHKIVGAASSAWDILVKGVKEGIGLVVKFFTGLPDKAIGALWGLGHRLFSFAKSALGEFWSGLKNVWTSVWGWIKKTIGGIPHDIMSFLHMSPPHPGSAFYDLGASMMHHMEAGMKSRVQNIGFGTIVGGMGGGVRQWAGLVRRALAMEGLSPSLLGRVLYQMQTESGGNPNAINNWDVNARMGDPSRGLMQVIGTTFSAYHWPGTSWNIYNPLANIAAALNYARHVYGPTLMSGGMGIGSGHGYAIGSWNVPYTGAALIHKGEMIVPAGAAAAIRAGAGGSTTYNINVNVPVSANKAEVGRQVVEAIRMFEQRSGAGWRK